MKKTMKNILIALFICAPELVFAASFGVGHASTSSGSTGGSTPSGDTYYTKEMGSEETYNYVKDYTCIYDYSRSSRKQITVNGYDIYGNSLMETSINISKKDSVVAGTPVSLSLYETKKISWEVTKVEVKIETKRKRRKYSCRYTPIREVTAIPVNLNDISQNNNINLNNIETDEKNVQNIALASTTIYYWSSHGALKSYCEENNPDSTKYRLSYYSTSPVSDEIKYSTESTEISNDENYIKECEKIAVEKVISRTSSSFAASYNIKMTDSNDINGSEITEITKQDASETIRCTDINGNEVSCEAGKTAFVYQEGVRKDEITATFTYQKNKVCMNVKTAKVTYRNDQCEDDEYEVPNKTYDGLEYWNFFIPLNAKSSSSVEVNLLPADGGKLDKDECNYVMKNNPVIVDSMGNVVEETLTGRLAMTYINLINPIDETKTFDGKYCYKYEGKDEVICNEESMDFKEIVTNGCYLTSKIKIPIKQLFYNENKVASSTETIFNGFNFYYKPIDISKSIQTDIIFPNGVNTNSSGELTTITLWDEWYSDQNSIKTNKALDLSQSFTQKTYIATNINAGDVIRYNEDNPYTSWENMNVDGTSNFIGSLATGGVAGVVSRFTADTDKIYKLGCGPANENEFLLNTNGTKLVDASGNPILNPLYIKGCEPK